jgi:hypothetical protein
VTSYLGVVRWLGSEGYNTHSFPFVFILGNIYFFNPPYNLMSSLYFKAYKNGYKELAFIILFILLILYIPSLSVVFILTLI